MRGVLGSLDLIFWDDFEKILGVLAVWDGVYYRSIWFNTVFSVCTCVGRALFFVFLLS